MISRALILLRPGAAWRMITGETYDDIEWLDETQAKPTREEVESALAVVSKDSAWSRIKVERDRRTREGGYQVAGKWFHSDEFSRGQQLGLVLLGSSIPAGLQWKTMDGTFVTMTPTLAQQILAAGAASDVAIFAAAETHKAAMEASADPAAYDLSGGWPKVFDEA